MADCRSTGRVGVWTPPRGNPPRGPLRSLQSRGAQRLGLCFSCIQQLVPPSRGSAKMPSYGSYLPFPLCAAAPASFSAAAILPTFPLTRFCELRFCSKLAGFVGSFGLAMLGVINCDRIVQSLGESMDKYVLSLIHI